MNTMEVLTLLLVIFTALTYLDNHRKQQKGYSLLPQGIARVVLLCNLITCLFGKKQPLDTPISLDCFSNLIITFDRQKSSVRGTQICVSLLLCPHMIPPYMKNEVWHDKAIKNCMMESYLNIIRVPAFHRYPYIYSGIIFGTDNLCIV